MYLDDDDEASMRWGRETLTNRERFSGSPRCNTGIPGERARSKDSFRRIQFYHDGT